MIPEKINHARHKLLTMKHHLPKAYWDEIRMLLAELKDAAYLAEQLEKNKPLVIASYPENGVNYGQSQV